MNGIRFIVGVTGGIAAYKTAGLVSSIVQAGADVRVVMTESARQFVGPATFAALTGHAVPDDTFDSDAYPLGAHIELARPADVLCIAPASANFIGKMALGLADDLLSTICLCFSGPVIVAPAMNREMWSKAAVQRNIDQIRLDGVVIVAPEEGWLSCRDVGVGRMAAPERIIETLTTIAASIPRTESPNAPE